MTSVIIAAAGSGLRMGGSIKKQYRNVENLPVLAKTVKAFCLFDENFQVIIVCPPGDEEYVKEMLRGFRCTVIAGGKSRQHSVANGLKEVLGECVLVHDAARCFVDGGVIERVLGGLKTADAVVPCVRPKSTIRTAEKTLDRAELYEVQTPQGFKTELLKKAHAKALADGFSGTDDISLVERMGLSPLIVEGSYANIKITTEEDMPKNIRVGHGYDVHRMVEGRELWLGCTKLPCERGLLGHSDADVLSHAIADALLGAAALRDIGFYLPDNLEETEGMSGKELLVRILDLVRSEGYSIVNIDSTIVAQSPKLSPFIEDMKSAVANALELDVKQIGIKATTEEGLGITGNGEAMAAYAVASIE